MVRVVVYLYLLLLHVLLVKITYSVSKKSHKDPSRPKYTINLNEPPPINDDAGVYISHNLKPNQCLSRQEIKATFPTCSHKRGCSHWKQMRQDDKDWSRTRRYLYSKPELIRKAEYRKYTKTYKDKLISNPEQRKAFNKHSNELRAARLKTNAQERQAYLEKKRAITRKSKRKKRDQEIKNSLKRTKE